MAYKKSNPNGQATMANSEPVVIASDQSAVPVSAASLPLPSGAATSAKQDTGNTSLATIAGAVAGTEMQVDVLSVIPGVGATNLGKQKDAAVGGSDTGVALFGRLRYSPAHSSGSDGAYDTFDITAWHELRTRDQRAIDLASCNDYTEFTTLGNDTANLANTANHVFGTGAITFDKVNGAANTVYAGVQKSVTSIDISEIFEDGGFVALGVYLPSLTNVVAVFLRVGTDSSNYNIWQWDVADLSAAHWLALRQPTNQPHGYAGNGWNTSAVTYVAFGVQFSGETNTLSGIIFDNVHFIDGRVTDSTIDATISSSVTTPNVNLHRIGGQPTDVGNGTTGTGTLRVTLSSDSTGLLSVDDNGGSLTVDGTITANAGTNLNTSALALESGGNLAASATSLAILDDWDESDRAKVNLIAAQAGVEGGSDIITAKTLRVTVATDDAVVSSLGNIDTNTASLGAAVGEEDAATGDQEAGMKLLATRMDTPANTSTTDGDLELVKMSAGRLWTSSVITGTVAVTQSGTWDEVGINDSGNSITVDAPVGTPVFVRLSDGASAISTLPVSLASVPSHAVTNAGTFVVQENGAALTSLQLIDDIVYTDDTSTHSTGTSKGALIMAAAAPTDTAVNANDIGAVGMTVNRELYVSLTTALPAGTNGIGKLTSNSGVTIGAVEIAASQTLGTLTTLTGGGVAHDGADSGNPVKIGARAASTLSDDTMVANADRTDAVSDLDGTLIVRPNYPLGDVISERTSNTDGASTASTNFGATASTRNCITGYHVFRTDAGTTPIYIDFRDGTGGSVLWSAVIPPNGGSNSPQYSGPCLFRTSANTALAYDVSAATTTVYINVTGFKSKV